MTFSYLFPLQDQANFYHGMTRKDINRCQGHSFHLKKRSSTFILTYGKGKYRALFLHTTHLKPLDTFGTEKKVHRFTNNLQSLQKLMGKDFS